MKYSTLFAMLACATTSATARASVVPPATTFTEINHELQTLATHPQVQAAMKSATPLLQQFGVETSFDTKLGFGPMDLLNIIAALDNSVVAFHDVVDSAGGQLAFQNAGNAVSSAYLRGLLGHLNAANVENAKIARITTDVQAVFNQSVELVYVDLYNVIYTDLSTKLITDAISVAVPAVKIVADIRDIAAALKELFGDHKRALFEQVEDLSDELIRVLEAGDLTKENFICKMQPVISKIIDVIKFLSSEQIKKDMGDIAKLLSDFPASNKVIVALQDASEAIYKFLQTYDPMIHDLIVPIANDIVKYIEGLCNPKHNVTRLLADNGELVEFNPMDLFTTVLDFLDKVIKAVAHFLDNLPQPLTKDALQVIYDIIELIAPEKAPFVKKIADDVVDVTQEMTSLLPALNTTVADIHLFIADSAKTMDDMKTFVFSLIALFRSLIAK